MFKSACDVMKKSIILSVLLMLLGSVLEAGALFLSLETSIPVFLIYGGLAAIFLGLILLLVILFAVMLPNVSKRLSACQN